MAKVVPLNAEMEDEDGAEDNMESSTLEAIESGLADLVDILEKSSPRLATALADALKKLPQPQVNVEAPSIPAPVVTIERQTVKGWVFTHEYDSKDRLVKTVATPKT